MFSHVPAIAVDVIMAFMTFCIRNDKRVLHNSKKNALLRFAERTQESFAVFSRCTAADLSEHPI